MPKGRARSPAPGVGRRDGGSLPPKDTLCRTLPAERGPPGMGPRCPHGDGIPSTPAGLGTQEGSALLLCIYLKNKKMTTTTKNEQQQQKRTKKNNPKDWNRQTLQRQCHGAEPQPYLPSPPCRPPGRPPLHPEPHRGATRQERTGPRGGSAKSRPQLSRKGGFSGRTDGRTDGSAAAQHLLARGKSTGMEGARAEAEPPRAAQVLEAKAPGGQGKGTGLGGQQRWGGTGRGKQERSQHRAPATQPSRCPLQGKCWETWASGRLEIN